MEFTIKISINYFGSRKAAVAILSECLRKKLISKCEIAKVYDIFVFKPFSKILCFKKAQKTGLFSHATDKYFEIVVKQATLPFLIRKGYFEIALKEINGGTLYEVQIAPTKNLYRLLKHYNFSEKETQEALAAGALAENTDTDPEF